VRLIEFLVDLGHRNIGYIYKEGIIFDEKTNPNQLNRISAYRDTLRRRGLAIDRAKELCLPRTNEMELLARFLREAQPPTALVCSNDHEAMRMCRMARELGIDVPRQLSVVGYDGIPEGATAWPPLTTIATPLQEMGRRGVNVLLEKQRNPGQLPARLVLPGVLVQRGSHAPLQS
jgi:LacI family transcriptional regulator